MQPRTQADNCGALKGVFAKHGPQNTCIQMPDPSSPLRPYSDQLSDAGHRLLSDAELRLELALAACLRADQLASWNIIPEYKALSEAAY